jgi:hypothetical protein
VSFVCCLASKESHEEGPVVAGGFLGDSLLQGARGHLLERVAYALQVLCVHHDHPGQAILVGPRFTRRVPQNLPMCKIS